MLATAQVHFWRAVWVLVLFEVQGAGACCEVDGTVLGGSGAVLGICLGLFEVRVFARLMADVFEFCPRLTARVLGGMQFGLLVQVLSPGGGGLVPMQFSAGVQSSACLLFYGVYAGVICFMLRSFVKSVSLHGGRGCLRARAAEAEASETPGLPRVLLACLAATREAPHLNFVVAENGTVSRSGHMQRFTTLFGVVWYLA